MKTYALAILLPPLLMFIWFAVQSAWRHVFFTTDADGDVLAGRSNCGQCGCVVPCDLRKTKEGPER